MVTKKTLILSFVVVTSNHFESNTTSAAVFLDWGYQITELCAEPFTKVHFVEHIESLHGMGRNCDLIISDGNPTMKWDFPMKEYSKPRKESQIECITILLEFYCYISFCC